MTLIVGRLGRGVVPATPNPGETLAFAWRAGLPRRAYLRMAHLEIGGCSMNRTRALILSLAVGVAAIAGVFALGHTIALGQQSRSTTDGAGGTAHRAAQPLRGLASQGPRAEATQAASRPHRPAASGSVQSAAPVRVVYHRPRPWSSSRTAPAARTTTKEVRPMTDTSHRTYAVVIAAVIFFVSWAQSRRSRGRQPSPTRGSRPSPSVSNDCAPTRSSSSASSTGGWSPTGSR